MKKLLMLAVMMMVAGSAFASGGLGFGIRNKCTDWAWQCNAWNKCRTISTDVNSQAYKDCAKPIVESCMASMSCDAKKYFSYLYQ